MSNSYTYNGLDARVGKVDSSGTATYRRDGADVTDDVLSDGAAVYTPGVSQRRAGATTYDLSDRLGTASRQTNAAKGATATRSYDAFGMLLSTTGSPKGPFGFAGAHGYQEDGDTGLKLLGHRVYDPSTGRFLTRDPIKDGTGSRTAGTIRWAESIRTIWSGSIILGTTASRSTRIRALPGLNQEGRSTFLLSGSRRKSLSNRSSNRGRLFLNVSTSG